MSKKKIRKEAKTEFKENQKFNILLFVLFAVFICIFTTYKIAGDDDVFWHLATGRYIVQNFSIPSTDVFGYMTTGQKWIPFEWGWDTLTYLLYNAGGFYSLSIFRTIILLSFFAIIFIYFKKQKISYNLSVVLSILLLFGILTRLSIRPQIISYFFFVLLIYILLYFKSHNNIKKSVLYVLPAVFLIWANMHMGVLLGILIFMVFIISELIEYYKSASKSPERRLRIKYFLLAFLFSLIALLINPNFIDTYFYTFRHSQMDMLEQINEWKSPFSSSISSFYNVKIYIFFLIIGIITLYYSVKRKDYFPSLIYIVFGLYSLQAMRFISDYMIIIFIPLVISINYIFNSEKIKNNINSTFVKIIIVIVLLFLSYNAYDSSFYKKYLGNYFRETGFGENEKFFPKDMFDFMKAEGIHNTGERPFNNLKIGGYFIWNFPGNKNLIDSRNLNDSIYTLYKNIDLKKPGFENIIESLDIDYFIYSTPYLTINAGEIERNIISYLSRSGDKWKLVYWDDRSFLFVKNIRKFENVISKFEYKYISPYNFVFDRENLNKKYNADKEGFTSEIKRKLDSETDGKFIRDMAEFYRRMN